MNLGLAGVSFPHIHPRTERGVHFHIVAVAVVDRFVEPCARTDAQNSLLLLGAQRLLDPWPQTSRRIDPVHLDVVAADHGLAQSTAEAEAMGDDLFKAGWMFHIWFPPLGFAYTYAACAVMPPSWM